MSKKVASLFLLSIIVNTLPTLGKASFAADLKTSLAGFAGDWELINKTPECSKVEALYIRVGMNDSQPAIGLFSDKETTQLAPQYQGWDDTLGIPNYFFRHIDRAPTEQDRSSVSFGIYDETRTRLSGNTVRNESRRCKTG